MTAMTWVAWPIPAALARCPGSTSSLMSANRAGLKNCAAAVVSSTVAYTATSTAVSGSVPSRRNATAVSKPMSTALARSAPSIVRRWSHRSTNTPAGGPTNRVPTATTTTRAETAAGAYDLSASTTVTTTPIGS